MYIGDSLEHQCKDNLNFPNIANVVIDIVNHVNLKLTPVIGLSPLVHNHTL